MMKNATAFASRKGLGSLLWVEAQNHTHQPDFHVSVESLLQFFLIKKLNMLIACYCDRREL